MIQGVSDLSKVRAENSNTRKTSNLKFFLSVKLLVFWGVETVAGLV